MMSELTDLYQEVILDHNRQPRNFRKMEEADRVQEGYNPLCGDLLTLYLKMDGDRVQNVSFVGSGCAISKASTSMMTTAIKGKAQAEVERLFHSFHDLVIGKSTGPTDSLGNLVIFSGVAKFPTRVKCATLAWHTLLAALRNERQPVTTEEESLPAPKGL
ncbi:MAG: SUF system NifU family Fe-S cluster assembly protein [Deltaproteobacteria bacterium]|nr:SUF system NifU family Fe-S cluster assembly protein [Deltaproteobacteria bacterium]